MLEPRRIAARTAARRMAFEAGETVGRSVGYRVRFDDCTGPDTDILVVTEGVLLRQLQDDPFLEDVGVVVFDEFHERRLDSDLALAMTRRVQQTVRPDLKIVVMSATLAAEKISAWLDHCPVIQSAGRLHPVQIRYSRGPLHRREIAEKVAEAVCSAVDSYSGDMLVFLPGVGEIRQVNRLLEDMARKQQLAVMPLFGDLPAEEQDRVLNPIEQRKIVLATNVAETSVTIEGITIVIDSGYARRNMFAPDIGLDRLELAPISAASADQRAGRAGRTAPGVCLRLWDEVSGKTRPAFETPEIQRVDLSSAVLRLYAWGENDVRGFPWFEQPSDSSLDHAERLLQLLGALKTAEDGQLQITETGRRLVRFPVAPRIAGLLVAGADLGVADRICLAAAMLSERSPFMESRSPGGGINTTGRPDAVELQSDVLDRLTALETFQRSRQPATCCGTINFAAADTISRVARQFAAVLREHPAGTPQGAKKSAGTLTRDSDRKESDERVLRALVAAFPDRLAKRRDVGSDKGLMVGGRAVRPAPRSAVRSAPLFLCVDVDGAGTDAYVRLASEVRREWLPADLLSTTDELFFHPSQKQVVARRRLRFADLLLEESPVAVT
ncbi:MAG: ATP-dependent RNA helicase, partial [Planctomycetaceae bacterium]|nr:ATP-dependent RNA helicase [Planctomycetaceae bacterium]